ncbi:substrate-binding domain-containing protein [Pseudaestuariivita sp.]|uniref:substrate-binding domain-containing protein n=1 Tax=Pseudaestuariivita sp. TaxID=2211669 RepID=UPI00405841A7
MPLRCIIPVAFKEGVGAFGPDFTSETGIALDIVHMLNPEVPGYVAEGPAWDLAMTNPRYCRQMIEAGDAVEGSHVPVARSPLAFAARAPVEEVAETHDALADLLTKSASIGLTGSGTSGSMFRDLTRKLGVSLEVDPKVHTLEGGGPMRALRAGEVELAALPLTNIAQETDVHVVGVCPWELGVHIDLSLCLSKSAQPEAQVLVNWLTDPVRNAELQRLGGWRFSH